MIMAHGDDDGMMMPPRVAPQQVIILPIVKSVNDDGGIIEFAQTIANRLKAKGMRAQVDKRDMRSGDKMWNAVKKGVPIRVEIGGREMVTKN